MKHVVVQADMTAGMRSARALLAGRVDFLRRTDTPTWLPAPSVRRCKLSSDQVPSRAKRASSIWLRPEPEHLGEKLMMGGLVAAAFVGVAYGLNMIINLVEHWAVFQTNVAQALQ